MNINWFKDTDEEKLDMGENVWVYMGELCPAYCLYTPWDQGGTE